MSNSVKKNTMYNMIKTISSIAFSLITFPYISRVLEPDGVGKINFGNSIISYLTLLAGLGVSTYAVRECSKYKGDREKLQKTASQIYSINICTMTIAYIVLIMLLLFVEPISKYGLLICIQSGSILLTIIGTDWLNTAMEEFRYITYRVLFFQILSLALMFIFVTEKDDYLIYAIITVISSGAGIVNIFYRRKYCNIRFTFDMDLNIHLKPILTLFVMLLAQTVYCNMDITMLGLMKGNEEVGVYSTAVRIYTTITQVITAVVYVVMPQMSKAYKDNDNDKIKYLSGYSLGFIGLLGVPCVLGMMLMAPQVVDILAGSAYTDAIILTRLLAVALSIALFGGFIGNIILLPSMREKYFLKSCIYAAIANFVLNLFLVPLWGAVGAAITTIIAELITLLHNAYCVKGEIEIGIIKDSLMKPIIAGLLLAPVLIMITMLNFNSVIDLILGVSLGGIVYFGTLYLLKYQFVVELVDSFFKKRRK